MKINEQSHFEIIATLKESLCRYVTVEDDAVYTDIHLQVKSDSGELIVFNDDEEELGRVIIPEWVENNEETFYQDVQTVLSRCLEELKETFIQKLALLRPYSFVLIDDEKETVADLMIIDENDTLLISGDLLQGLEQELDAFLKNLLEN